MPGGRPDKYRPEFCEQARKFCLLGAKDIELAKLFEVCEDTLNEWKKVHPEFSASIKEGRDYADAHVGERLYQRAMGYSHPEDKVFNDNGTPLIVKTIKHYPPDTVAAIFWLKNRQRSRWRDVQHQEVTGKDGGPIQTEDATARDLLLSRISGVASRIGEEEATKKPH